MPHLASLIRSGRLLAAGTVLAACSPASLPTPGRDGLVLQAGAIRVTPVSAGRVTVTGEAGSAAPPAIRVTLTVEAAATRRAVSHLGHITASASVALAADGSFGPVTLAGAGEVDPILAGYTLEMQAWTAGGEPGPYLVRILEAPASP
ncbi:MAG: hypothetical protein VKP57_05910 [Candidatus Sericytochromatia bacterium]|nr:hypothetical protein [Candidatus Sericytochromatia bacterium]